MAVSGLNLKALSVDDLSLIERSKTRSRHGLFMEQTLRNHSVLDSVTIVSILASGDGHSECTDMASGVQQTIPQLPIPQLGTRSVLVYQAPNLRETLTRGLFLNQPVRG